MTSTATATETVAPQVQVGSIFYSSWGYDQTNVDFYRVVRRTKATVWVQKTTKAFVNGQSTGGPTEHVVATEGVATVSGWRDGEYVTGPAPVRKHRLKVSNWGSGDHVGFHLNSYSDASLWDGTPQYETGAAWGR